MIYGEGKKAFIRLQKAIATATDDLSLFAWSEESASSVDYVWVRPGLFHVEPLRGILADSPSQFSGCHKLRNVNCPAHFDCRSFVMANRDVQFTAYLTYSG